MSDIVERLRAYVAGESAGTWQGDWFSEAAAAIEARDAEIARLREALDWRDISTAPQTKGDYFWCELRIGPEEDPSTTYGFRWKDKWFAAASFYKGGRFDECQYEMRQIEVKPTHWREAARAALKVSP